MNLNTINQPLSKKWSRFLEILFDPINISLIILCIIFYFLSFTQVSGIINAILTLIISLLTGVLGGIIAKEWEKTSEERVIVARGKSAIRSLKLLFSSVVELEKRVRIYLERYQAETNIETAAKQTIRTYLEEVIQRCNLLEEEVINSIENWTDIIPEADVSTQIGYISELKLKLDKLNEEVYKLNEEMKSKSQSDGEKASLIEKIKKSEEQIMILQHELRARAYLVESNLFTSGSAVIYPSDPNETSIQTPRLPGFSKINQDYKKTPSQVSTQQAKQIIREYLEEGRDKAFIISQLKSMNCDEEWVKNKIESIIRSLPRSHNSSTRKNAPPIDTPKE